MTIIAGHTRPRGAGATTGPDDDAPRNLMAIVEYNNRMFLPLKIAGLGR